MPCRYSERPGERRRRAARARRTPRGARKRGRTSGRLAALPAVAPRNGWRRPSLHRAPRAQPCRRSRCAPVSAAACATARGRFSRRAPACPTSTARAAAGRTRSRSRARAACSRSSSTNSRRAWWRDVTSDSAQSDEHERAARGSARVMRHAPSRPAGQSGRQRRAGALGNAQDRAARARIARRPPRRRA